jgi:SAM-dependent methyltransferase
MSIFKTIRNLRNAADFALRSRVRVAFPYRARNEEKTGVFDALPPDRREAAVRRERELRDRYGLGGLYADSPVLTYERNLWALDLLERGLLPLPRRDGAVLRVLDVGSKDFAYAPALDAFFRVRTGAAQVALTGVELDAYRRYTNLHTRADHAAWHIRNLPAARYVPGSVLEVTGTFDFITWFSPFVTPEPHARWGLPMREFQPGVLLRHVLGLLAPGGTLLLSHPTEGEARVQRGLLNGVRFEGRDGLDQILRPPPSRVWLERVANL